MWRCLLFEVERRRTTPPFSQLDTEITGLKRSRRFSWTYIERSKLRVYPGRLRSTSPLLPSVTELDHVRYREVRPSRVLFVCFWYRRSKRDPSLSPPSPGVLETVRINPPGKRTCSVRVLLTLSTELCPWLSPSSFYFLVRFYKVCFLVLLEVFGWDYLSQYIKWTVS